MATGGTGLPVFDDATADERSRMNAEVVLHAIQIPGKCLNTLSLNGNTPYLINIVKNGF